MVLMHLRLNAGIQDLGYWFDIHPLTVCRYFTKWLDVLHTKLNVFINWPERGNLLKTVPTVFWKAFWKCSVIRLLWSSYWKIYFTEGTTQTWSNYKKHNTAKFLIGTTPQGSISFISKGWGGRVSLTDPLLPGEVTEGLPLRKMWVCCVQKLNTLLSHEESFSSAN